MPTPNTTSSEPFWMRLCRRSGYTVGAAFIAALGGQLAALLGFLFIVAVAEVNGARLISLLTLLLGLVLAATLVHLLRAGWGHTAFTHPSCQRIQAAFRCARLEEQLSAETLSGLLRDLEALPGLYTRLALGLSSLVVAITVLDAMRRGEPFGWYMLGGAIAILIYGTYVSSITELMLFSPLRQVRHALAQMGEMPSARHLRRLNLRMARLLMPNLVAVVVLTALFGQRPELARHAGLVILLGGGLMVLSGTLTLLALSTLRRAHDEIRQAVRVLVEHGEAQFISGSTAQDFVDMAADIYQMGKTLLSVQQALQGMNQMLEERITARVAELEQQRQVLYAILENIAEGLVVTDSVGRVVMTNDVFRRMAPLELSAAELNLRALFPNAGLQNLLRQAITEPERAHELQFVAPNRQVYQVLARALPPETGLGTVMVLHDITRDVELAHMKTNFISSVSHELRTPLTSILGFAKLTRRTFEQIVQMVIPKQEGFQRAAERVARNLDILIQESERLTNLINDVLDLAALDSGKVEWNDVMCEPHLLIEESVMQHQPLVEKKGLRLMVELSASLPLIKADPLRIRQVLDNLLSNAVKFTSSGWVKVSARALAAGERVEQWTAPASGGVLICVTDTGPGIPIEYQPYIFERFWQGGDYIHDKPKGTGLGLALSRDIIRHYQGYIGIGTSELGQGAVFYVALPAAEQAHEVWQTPSMVAASSLSHRDEHRQTAVLVVDDDPAILAWLKEELEQRAFRVLSAQNAMEGMTLARMHHPNAIILDLMMPGISGLELLRLLKADAKTATIPVVVLTIADEREASLNLGAAAYLKKPVEAQRLVDTLLQVITDEDIKPVGVE